MSIHRTIVCATDFSDAARAALDEAAEIARGSSAALHVAHVFRYPVFEYPTYSVAIPENIMQEARDEAARELAREVARVEAAGGSATTHLLEGLPAEAIGDLVEEIDADLLVMGTRAHRGLAHLVLGSIAERTARRVPCSVLIVKTPSTDTSAS